MALPGFTAEASIGPTTQVYRVQDRYGTVAPAYLHPQSIGAELDQDSWEDDLGNGSLEDEDDLGNESLGDEDAAGMEGDEEFEVGDEV